MIDFLVHRRENVITNDFTENSKCIILNQNYVLYVQADKLNEYNIEDRRVIIIGDSFGEVDLNNMTLAQILYSLKGFYYIFEIGESIKIASSLFNFLPIYYSENLNQISSSFSILSKHCVANKEIDKKYILEQLLFNFGFFNRTLLKSISLLKSNYYISISNNSYELVKHYDISKSFHSSKDTSTKTRRTLAKKFIDITQEYLPEDFFSISFTGGFDGRTLVSCASNSKRYFETFSFGKNADNDVVIPMRNAKELNIPYTFINLEEDTYIENYLKFSLNLVEDFGGFNGFIYSHFTYCTSQLSSKKKYVLTGYAGSEIFKTSLNAGAITSKALYDLFSKNRCDFEKAILKSDSLKALKLEFYENELNELINELYNYKESLTQEITLNQKFYTFVFEEIFRKTFGVLTKAQMKYVNVRIPYLDIIFIEALLKTGFGGANNDFYSKNFIKRFRGQVLYGEIIKQTNEIIFKQKTGRGYKPSDLITPLGWVNILTPFIFKKINNKITKENLDNLSIISGVSINKDFFKSYLSKSIYFDINFLNHTLNNFSPNMNERERDLFLSSISLIYSIKALNS